MIATNYYLHDFWMKLFNSFFKTLLLTLLQVSPFPSPFPISTQPLTPLPLAFTMLLYVSLCHAYKFFTKPTFFHPVFSSLLSSTSCQSVLYIYASFYFVLQLFYSSPYFQSLPLTSHNKTYQMSWECLYTFVICLLYIFLIIHSDKPMKEEHEFSLIWLLPNV